MKYLLILLLILLSSCVTCELVIKEIDKQEDYQDNLEIHHAHHTYEVEIESSESEHDTLEFNPHQLQLPKP